MKKNIALRLRADVRVPHPLEQGLRPISKFSRRVYYSQSAPSIRTRIKTFISSSYIISTFVRVPHPLEQGLRLASDGLF